MTLQRFEDRGMAVPPGQIVRTAYVRIDQVSLACKARMAVGDVENAYRRRLGCAPAQPWPCPVGQWVGERFEIHDGRHEYVAALMLGCEHILVAWIEGPSPAAVDPGEATDGESRPAGAVHRGQNSREDATMP